ncbi:podocalyxin [Hyaena hyaena]|uniref:podocalyxin n=1 Tax=Hyaena hyaena TaxID=95912 RepID=UPI0019235346|nr:podocalyxin [Hyaena hyaena]
MDLLAKWCGTRARPQAGGSPRFGCGRARALEVSKHCERHACARASSLAGEEPSGVRSPPAARRTHVHHPARPGAASPEPAASPRSPARGAPGRSFLLCSFRRPGPAAQTPPATQPPAAPPPGSAPQSGSAAAVARRGSWSATREPRVTTRPREPQPGLPERRPRSRCSDARTRSHLLPAGGQDTMRSALALSVLPLSVLLLLVPLPRPVFVNADLSTTGSANVTTSIQADAKNSDGTQIISPPLASTVPKLTQKTEPSVPTLDATSKSPNASSSNPAQKNKAVTTTVKVTEAHTTHRPETQDSSQPTPSPTLKPTKPDTTHSQPAGSGAQSGPSVSTDHANIQGMTPKTVPPLMNSASTAHTPSTAAPASPQQPPATAVSNPSGSSPEEPDKNTTASSSVRTSQSPGSTLQGAPTVPASLVTSQGNQQYSSKVPAAPGTPSSVARTPSSVSGTPASVAGTPASVAGTPASVAGTPASVAGTPASVAGTPASVAGTPASVAGTPASVPGTRSSVPGTPSSIPGTSSSEALLPAGPSLGPVATSPVTGPGGFSTHLAPATRHDSSRSSPSSTPRNDGALPVERIQCGHPENPTEKMLILNFTKTSPCAKNFSDDKLVRLLCRAAKATFNPAQDECHIQLAPIPEVQAVAIKGITIQTSLRPTDVYESLKDKWDELKEAGVSNMRLGDQGPPEETEDRFSMPLIITIVCMASFLLLVAALYGCCHQRLSQRKDQQRLTEELQTVENGYHDNPTLEVMETSSEMQEKKVVNLNGELGDSWIVPLDNLTKDDLDEEEDTHL